MISTRVLRNYDLLLGITGAPEGSRCIKVALAGRGVEVSMERILTEEQVEHLFSFMAFVLDEGEVEVEPEPNFPQDLAAIMAAFFDIEPQDDTP